MQNKKYTIPADVLTQEVSGETVLLKLNSEDCFGLDEVATRIWQLLQVKEDIQGVLGQLLQEYDVKAERLEQDVTDLLKALVDAGLLATADE